MRKSTVSIVIASLAMVLVLAPGCVTKKQFRSNVEDTDTRAWLDVLRDGAADGAGRFAGVPALIPRCERDVARVVDSGSDTGNDAPSL